MKKAACTFLATTILLSTGCKKEADPAPISRVKRVVRLTPMENKFIELDDGARYGMGENLYNRLVTKLQASQNFVVVVNENWKPKTANLARLTADPAEEIPFDPSDRLHFEFAPVAAADFNASVEQLTFSHGSKANRRFAGFTTEFKTPFNDGSFNIKNEYPPRSLDFVNGWFGNTLDPTGEKAETNSIAGVTAGEEGEFNLVVANVIYRRDSYFATAKVNTKLQLLAENEYKERLLDASGTGFLFALGATYQNITAEFGIARKTALKDTFDRTVDKMAAEIQNQLFKIPFRSKIEKVGSEGIILNAGRREGIQIGDVFLHNAGGKITSLKVVEVFLIGSRVEMLSGDFRSGDAVVMQEATPAAVSKVATKSSGVRSLASSSSSSISVPDNRAVQGNPVAQKETFGIVIDPPEFSDPDGNIKDALSAKKYLGFYLLWRWSQYDQEPKSDAASARGDIFAAAKARWDLQNIHVEDAWKRGLSGNGVKVAILDSGVDYNHKNLALSISRSNPGFDFMSYENRPFDDNSHGTAIAGLIGAQAVEKNQVGIAPGATILSYKVFDPFSNTTSAALYGAFEKAIADGAKIIVCAWNTKKESDALKKAVQLAEAKGVLVITAAGDRGEDIRTEANFPARYNQSNNVISVGSSDQAGNLGQITGRYSNYGAGAVDILAPGISLSVLSPRNEYIVRSGSDLAAAEVAGVAALVWERNPSANAAQVKDQILRHSQRKPALENLVTEGRLLDAGLATE